MILLFAGLVMVMVIACAIQLGVWLTQSAWGPRWWLAWAAKAGPNAVILAGVVLATWPCPQSIVPGVRSRVRRMARIMAFICLVGMAVVPLLQWYLGQVAYNYWMVDMDGPLVIVNALISAVPVVWGTLALLTMWLTARYLASVLSFMHAGSLERHFRIAAYGILISVAALHGLRLVLTISMGWFGRANVVLDPDSIVPLVFGILAWTIFVAYLVFYVWILVVLARSAGRLAGVRAISAAPSQNGA